MTFIIRAGFGLSCSSPSVLHHLAEFVLWGHSGRCDSQTVIICSHLSGVHIISPSSAWAHIKIQLCSLSVSITNLSPPSLVEPLMQTPSFDNDHLSANRICSLLSLPVSFLSNEQLNTFRLISCPSWWNCLISPSLISFSHLHIPHWVWTSPRTLGSRGGTSLWLTVLAEMD